MYLSIDQSSGTPVYIQITEQIKKAISIGVFEVGKPIPTIREIALQLRINPNTVAKAIRELEREGILKTFVGKGSFVTENSLNITKKDKEEQALKVVEQFIKDIKWINLDKETVINMIQENWDKLSENK
ncbi:MAG: GntR family transcriptional regulator [Candidatus Sericytochromatia bacterium]